MEYSILLDRQSDFESIELTEQSRFIKSILESLEIPIDFDPDATLSVEQKLKLKKDLDQFNIKIISNSDRSVNVYVDKDIIGKWVKPSFKLKQDFSHIDPKKRLYVEMIIKFWTIFEEEEANDNKINNK